MRIGQNPAKFVGEVAKPQRITVAVLAYIPFLSGFYAQTLEVLKLCLGSIWETADLPYDLLVFDNGSCAEAMEYLMRAQGEGRIQLLILSDKNLGKGGAWNVIFAAAPGEIIAYSDSDALFYPGWLSKSVRILETYPDVGMVTSRPFRTPPEFYSNTLAWAAQTDGVSVERGQLIPWEVFFEFDRSLGQDEVEIRTRYERTADVRLSYDLLPAYVGASHWQFVAKKSVLQQFLPFQMDRPMGQVRQLDQRMNEAGYLRLMTAEPLAMNMSNMPPLADEARTEAGPSRPRRRRNRLLHAQWVKRGLLALYDRIFRWYYADS